MKKLVAHARALDVVFKVMHTVLTVLAIVCAVCILVVAAGFVFDLPSEMIGTGYGTLDLDFLSLTFAENAAPSPKAQLMFAAAAMAMGVVVLLIGRRCVAAIRAMLQPMKEGRPFHSAVSTNLRTLGVLSVVLGVAGNVMKLVVQFAMTRMLDLETLLLGEKITAVAFNYTFDLSFLVLTAVLFLLAYVFRYGEELQTLSDETL